MWLEYGNPPFQAGDPRDRSHGRLPYRVVAIRLIHTHRGVRKSDREVLTRFGAAAYIAPTRRAAARRDGAPAKLLTDNGDQPPTCCVGGRGFGGSPACPGRGILVVPGCLTGESEERETWTAESLRAASSGGSILRIDPGAVAAGRDFGGTRFRSTPYSVKRRVWARRKSGSCPQRAWIRWDLVKRCDQPEQVLIQLESLILAQSERWRQA